MRRPLDLAATRTGGMVHQRGRHAPNVQGIVGVAAGLVADRGRRRRRAARGDAGRQNPDARTHPACPLSPRSGWPRGRGGDVRAIGCLGFRSAARGRPEFQFPGRRLLVPCKAAQPQQRRIALAAGPDLSAQRPARSLCALPGRARAPPCQWRPRPFASRSIRYRHPNFWLDLPQGQSLEFLLRVQSQSTMQVPLVLYTPTAFIESERDAQFSIGLYYGILLALFFYNLVLWLRLRDSSYFWYLLHISAFGLVLFTLNGLGFEYLWPNSSWLADKSVPLVDLPGADRHAAVRAGLPRTAPALAHRRHRRPGPDRVLRPARALPRRRSRSHSRPSSRSWACSSASAGSQSRPW